MQNDKLLYENIKKRRLELNMSQQDLAEAVGYKGKSMISQVENGQIDLPITMVKKFAEALRVDAGDLMGWEEFDIAHDGNIIYDREQIRDEIRREILDELNRTLEDADNLEIESDDKVFKAYKLYEMYAKATPDVQSAVELLLKSAQQSPESSEKN